MYTSFFGLSEKPFAITPDPRYLFLSERHAEALAHLLYGINESGGFIQLTGEVGTGKTTVVRTLLSRIPQHADVAVILNPRITPTEFLLTICEELGVDIAPADRDSVKSMVDAMNRRLLSAHADGRRVIVIVDEAQNLSAPVLEQVRLLTNLETPTQKLLQIILIGQPELAAMLDRTDLRQLAQRITGRYHLNPLTREETQDYVRHRLRVAGVSAEVFTRSALREIHRLSGGVPRIINVCCDRALLGAYTREQRIVNAALIRRAAGEVYGRRYFPRWVSWLAAGAAAAAIAAAALLPWRSWMPPATTALTATATSDRPRTSANAPGAGGTSATPAAPAPASTAPAPASAALPATPGAAATATTDAPRPAPDIDALLVENSASTTEGGAFRRLLAMWGTALTGDKDPCGQAARAGLACLDQHGSWAQVRMLNRPAVLTLADDHGARHRVVLTALDDHFATLTLGEHSERLPIETVSRVWFGDFTVVWRPRTPRPRQLSIGSSGDEVRWLRRSLSALRGSSVDPEQDAVYDKELAAAVQDFQRQHRLNVDGIAGILTQAVLDAALADPQSPSLEPAKSRGG
ncbi:MAG: AAA family ATPase [Steroidobacterales bacterium]